MPVQSLRALLMCSAAGLIAMPALAQETVDLAPITVNSKRAVQVDESTSETVVDEEEIKDRQAATIAELVDSVPGVNLINGGSPVGSGINIRGFGATGTYGTDQKVGIQVGGAKKGSEELYRIGTQLYTDPTLYREAVVKRGMGGTFEYGSGNFGGLLLLEPIHASDLTKGEDGFRLRQTLEYSSNGDGLVSSTIGAFQQGNLEVLGNYTYRHMGITSDGDGVARSSSGYDLPSWLVNGRLTFGDADQHKISLLLSETSTDERDVPYDTFGTTGGSFGNVDRQTEDRTAVLRYDFDAPDTELVNLRVELSYSDQKIDQEYVAGSSTCDDPTNPCGFPGGFPAGGFASVNADHRYETTGLLIKNTAYLDTGMIAHELRTGIEYTHRKRLDANSAPGGVDKRLALFVVDDMSMGNFTLSPELRYETQEIGGSGYGTYNNSALMGGVSGTVDLGGGFKLLGGAWYNENLPILDDLGTPAYMTQSEKATTAELGFSYDGGNVIAAGDTLALKVVAYRTHMWDVTSYTTPTRAPYETVDMKGLELEASWSHTSGLYVDFNANISRGTGAASGTTYDWSGIPADTAQISFGKKWGETFDLSWEVVAAADMTRATTPTKGYAVHNLRAVYRPQDGALDGTEIRVGVENLFDRTYRPHLATRNANGRTLKVSLAKTF
jgi:hemoglobin/transferrin/lactoferrin receptor protein